MNGRSPFLPNKAIQFCARRAISPPFQFRLKRKSCSKLFHCKKKKLQRLYHEQGFFLQGANTLLTSAFCKIEIFLNIPSLWLVHFFHKNSQKRIRCYKRKVIQWRILSHGYYTTVKNLFAVRIIQKNHSCNDHCLATTRYSIRRNGLSSCAHPIAGLLQLFKAKKLLVTSAWDAILSISGWKEQMLKRVHWSHKSFFLCSPRNLLSVPLFHFQFSAWNWFHQFHKLRIVGLPDLNPSFVIHPSHYVFKALLFVCGKWKLCTKT